ncbi:glycosyltransferase family 4 protein [Flavicella sediminum]|uniref:glycosyltransferase family 4 protein n=1 Tax=Flavicella sediminum TaxID=2585141 RepID=UPI001124C684|nr:glycosyltransferase family 4 protein [Flavicella sediminum]
MKHKLIRITTVPISLDKLIEGQMAFMKSHYKVIAVSSDEKQLMEVGVKEGVDVRCIELTREITPIKDLVSLVKMYFFLRKEKPLIVHTHTPKAGTIGMLAAKLARVPIRLHTVAGLPLMEVKGKKRALLNFVEKLTYTCANKVFPNSFGLKDIILDLGFAKSEKLKVIGNGSSNGIDTSFFDPGLFTKETTSELKSEYGIQPEDLVFIFVGRLVGDKGINELIEAFVNLESKHAKIKLLLVGDFESNLDPLSNNTLKFINTNKNIIPVGFQKDVRPFFAMSHVLVFPSYREGFPNVVLQAGAMSLPSIVSNINGCNEIIVEGLNGVIVSVKNSYKIEKMMEKMIVDVDYRKKLSVNSRKNICNLYSQINVWEAILNEYKELEKNV